MGDGGPRRTSPGDGPCAGFGESVPRARARRVVPLRVLAFAAVRLALTYSHVSCSRHPVRTRAVHGSTRLF